MMSARIALLSCLLIGCDASETETIPATAADGVVVAGITHLRMDVPVDGHATAVVTVDKGRRHGIRAGLKALVQGSHPAAIYEFRVIDVSESTSELRGWHDPRLARGVRVVLRVGNVSDAEAMRYLTEECDPPGCEAGASTSEPGGAAVGTSGGTAVETSGGVATREGNLEAFLSRFYEAYSARNWTRMQSIASGEPEREKHFGTLVQLAAIFAQPGLQSSEASWSRGRSLDSADLVEFALCIQAAAQGYTDPRDARLSEPELAAIEQVLKTLQQAVSRGSPAERRDKERMARHIQSLLIG
jgi:hypothetical protein